MEMIVTAQDELRSRRRGGVSNSDFQGQQFKDNVAKVNQIKPLAQRLGKTIPQLVLRTLLTHAAVHCVIVGIKNPAQIEDCSGAMGWKLDRADCYQIRRTFMGY